MEFDLRVLNACCFLGGLCVFFDSGGQTESVVAGLMRRCAEGVVTSQLALKLQAVALITALLTTVGCGGGTRAFNQARFAACPLSRAAAFGFRGSMRSVQKSESRAVLMPSWGVHRTHTHLRRRVR